MSGRCLLQFAAAIGLAALAALPARAGDDFEAAGLIYFTFEIGGDAQGPHRPRFGLRFGGPAVPDPTDRGADLLDSSFGLELDLSGRSALSLGRVALPLDGGLFGAAARRAQRNTSRDLAATATPRAQADPPRSGAMDAAELPVAAGRWVFRPLGQADEAHAATAARAMVPAAGRATVEPVERGRWLFRPLMQETPPRAAGQDRDSPAS